MRIDGEGLPVSTWFAKLPVFLMWPPMVFPKTWRTNTAKNLGETKLHKEYHQNASVYGYRDP